MRLQVLGALVVSKLETAQVGMNPFQPVRLRHGGVLSPQNAMPNWMARLRERASKGNSLTGSISPHW